MDIQVTTNIILSVLSFLLAVISLVIVVITLRQNSKMIEESSRPFISIYTQFVNIGDPKFYLVVRNYGKSTAYLTKFTSDADFSKCYVHTTKNYIEQLSSCTIAPGQSRVCALDYDKVASKVADKVHFSIAYKSLTKTYAEEMDVNMMSAVGMPKGQDATPGKELSTISLTLQEMLNQNL